MVGGGDVPDRRFRLLGSNPKVLTHLGLPQTCFDCQQYCNAKTRQEFSPDSALADLLLTAAGVENKKYPKKPPQNPQRKTAISCSLLLCCSLLSEIGRVLSGGRSMKSTPRRATAQKSLRHFLRVWLQCFQ